MPGSAWGTLYLDIMSTVYAKASEDNTPAPAVFSGTVAGSAVTDDMAARVFDNLRSAAPQTGLSLSSAEAAQAGDVRETVIATPSSADADETADVPYIKMLHQVCSTLYGSSFFLLLLAREISPSRCRAPFSASTSVVMQPFRCPCVQVFKDNLAVENATGQTSIWGAAKPNSRKAMEVGYGAHVAADARRSKLVEKVNQALWDTSVQMTPALREDFTAWLQHRSSADKYVALNAALITCRTWMSICIIH